MKDDRTIFGAAVCLAIAGASSAAAQQVPAREELRAEAAGIEKVELRLRGGGALLSFYVAGVELEIVGEDRDDFLLSVSDERGGANFSRALPVLEREGDTLKAALDFGEFRIIRVGGGTTRARLAVPAAFRGSLSAAIAEGGMELRGLELRSLSAGVQMGKLALDGVRADRMVLSAREAGTSLRDSGAREGELSAGLGSFKATGLRGSWKVKTAEGSVDLAFAEAPGALDIKTGLGKVTLRLPEDAAFRLEASRSLGKPKADIPLTETVVREFPEERRVYVGEAGSGGPTVSIRTKEGGIEVSRGGDR